MNGTMFGLNYEGEITFQEFMSKAAGRLTFTQEELEIQMDQADKNGEPFTIIVKDTVYRIPQTLIKAYFQEHERPARPLNKDDQIELLRRQLADKEREISEIRGKKSIEGIVTNQTPYVATGASTRSPMPDAPLPESDRVVESETDMRQRLADELRGATPTFKRNIKIEGDGL